MYFGPFMSENQFNMVVQNNPPYHGNCTREEIAMLIGYGRVSTEDQSLNLQLDALKKFGVEEAQIYQEHVSAAKAKRPELVSFCGRCERVTCWWSGSWTGWRGRCHTSSRSPRTWTPARSGW